MSEKLPGLSGFTVCKNAVSLDYPVELAIASMLPLCDEVLVGDMGSTDGTLEMLAEMTAREPKLRIRKIHDWTLLRGDQGWWVNALNETRQHLRFKMMLQLDSDEVLGDDAGTTQAVRHAVVHTNAFAFDRLNFCRDPQSLIPEGECCGRHVVRIGPSHLHLPSDEPHPRGEVHILDMAFIQPAAKIFHIGFLRRPEAFFAKARVVLGAFFDNYDPRLAQAEADGKSPMSGMPWFSRLVPYHGYYPESVRKWCIARGYKMP